MGSPTLALTLPPTMQSLIFLAVIAAATAAPQIVPYVHEEIAAEPYIHHEIRAEPYVHLEPALTAEALGELAYSAPVVTGATGYAAGPLVVSGWSGACLNNLGPCPAGSERREERGERTA